MRFRISNRHSCVVLGEYDAPTSARALDMMAQDAGYRDYAECDAEVPSAEGEILVEEINDAEAAP